MGTSKQVNVVSVGDTSKGNIRVSFEYGSGYDSQYWMDKDEAKYLFNRLGRLLGNQ